MINYINITATAITKKAKDIFKNTTDKSLTGQHENRKQRNENQHKYKTTYKMENVSPNRTIITINVV